MKNIKHEIKLNLDNIN